MAKPQKPSSTLLKCPLCGHVFKRGNIGVWQHAGAYGNHPDWHPEAHDTNERKRLFEQEFPEVAKSARTPNRRVPPSHRDPKNRRLTPKFLHPAPARIPPPDPLQARLPGTGGTLTTPAAPAAIVAETALPQTMPGAAPGWPENWRFCPTCGKPR